MGYWKDVLISIVSVSLSLISSVPGYPKVFEIFFQVWPKNYSIDNRNLGRFWRGNGFIESLQKINYAVQRMG